MENLEERATLERMAWSKAYICSLLQIFTRAILYFCFVLMKFGFIKEKKKKVGL